MSVFILIRLWNGITKIWTAYECFFFHINVLKFCDMLLHGVMVLRSVFNGFSMLGNLKRM